MQLVPLARGLKDVVETPVRHPVHAPGDDGEPTFTRVGVGNHLMLGGDNMDLALARLVESRLTEPGTRLSAASLSQLVERCRAAKERLLGDDAPDSVNVTLLGAGSKLVGGYKLRTVPQRVEPEIQAQSCDA